MFGDDNVGKTELQNRFVHDRFDAEAVGHTVGADYVRYCLIMQYMCPE